VDGPPARAGIRELQLPAWLRPGTVRNRWYDCAHHVRPATDNVDDVSLSLEAIISSRSTRSPFGLPHPVSKWQTLPGLGPWRRIAASDTIPVTRAEGFSAPFAEADCRTSSASTGPSPSKTCRLAPENGGRAVERLPGASSHRLVRHVALLPGCCDAEAGRSRVDPNSNVPRRPFEFSSAARLTR
jgi:hypothetical protein